MSVNMIGPMGPKGCSKIACRKTAVQEDTYRVAHPGQSVYDVTYRWCEQHNAPLNPQTYPNFRRWT